MLVQTLTIVGVGLIGGSIGLAARSRGVARRVIGVGRDPANLAKARDLGAIDVACPQLIDAVREADFVVFCTPVDRIAEQIKQAAMHCPTGAILTDAGSTKHEIVQAVERDLPPHIRFLGAHPIAGSEKKGVDHARADLFDRRWTVLTPTAKTPATLIDAVRDFWQALGSQVRVMAPDEHDRALAMTSHMPHLLAAALAGILPDDLRELTATGFRDTTRIAAGDPEVWTPIFQHNRLAVVAAIVKLEERLREFRLALFSDDVAEMDKLLTQGKKVRDALGS